MLSTDGLMCIRCNRSDTIITKKVYRATGIVPSVGKMLLLCSYLWNATWLYWAISEHSLFIIGEQYPIFEILLFVFCGLLGFPVCIAGHILITRKSIMQCSMCGSDICESR